VTTSSSPDDDLSREVRARLSDYRLPMLDGPSKSHRGTGRPCIVCRRAIEPSEVERQVDAAGVLLYAHEACYKVWREESAAVQAARNRSQEAP
jgi:hypothetical protein